jgi:hypothetical protein
MMVFECLIWLLLPSFQKLIHHPSILIPIVVGSLVAVGCLAKSRRMKRAIFQLRDQSSAGTSQGWGGSQPSSS